MSPSAAPRNLPNAWRFDWGVGRRGGSINSMRGADVAEGNTRRSNNHGPSAVLTEECNGRTSRTHSRGRLRAGPRAHPVAAMRSPRLLSAMPMSELVGPAHQSSPHHEAPPRRDTRRFAAQVATAPISTTPLLHFFPTSLLQPFCPIAPVYSIDLFLLPEFRLAPSRSFVRCAAMYPDDPSRLARSFELELRP